jgi:hypothetical protein
MGGLGSFELPLGVSRSIVRAPGRRNAAGGFVFLCAGVCGANAHRTETVFQPYPIVAFKQLEKILEDLDRALFGYSL